VENKKEEVQFVDVLRFFKDVGEAFRSLSGWLTSHREEIEAFYLFLQHFDKIQPHIDNMLIGLNDPDFDIGNDVISISDIIESVDLDKDPEAASLMDVIANITFQEGLIKIYESTSLRKERVGLMRDAFKMHNEKIYSGSICLLYGLIEGVLTDAFVKIGFLMEKDGEIKGINNKSKEFRITGLAGKIIEAKKHPNSKIEYLEKLSAYELIAGDEKSTITKTRNSILHGNVLDFNNEKRSAQLILWLSSTLTYALWLLKGK